MRDVVICEPRRTAVGGFGGAFKATPVHELGTKRGDAAERLYRRLGWTEMGSIPGFAINPDGSPQESVFFYKHLR